MNAILRVRCSRIPPLALVGSFFLCFGLLVPAVAADRVYDAADLVRTARMLEGIIPADPDFADLDGDGQVTANDLALMLRRVHGQELPVRLEQKSIGPEGGSIGNTNTILLTVPEGAFATTETLTLERMPPGEVPRSNSDHGPLYQIRGIPFDAAAALTVRVAVPEGVDIDETHVEVGHMMFGRPRGFDWHYLIEDSEPDGNALVWQLDPVPASVWDDLRAPESAAFGGDSGPRAALGHHTIASYRTHYVIRNAWVGYSTMTGPRFMFFFPRERSSPGAQIPIWLALDALEASFATLTNANFDFSPRMVWPINVTFKDLGESGGEVPSAWTMDSYQIHLHEKLLDDYVNLRSVAAHEFFHVVQGFYGARNWDVVLNEATATWFEKYMAWNSDDYVPDVFVNDARAAIRGMQHEGRWVRNPEWGLSNPSLAAPDTSEAQARGYALSSFFEYLSTLPGCNLERLRLIYEQIKAGRSQIGALRAAMPGTFQQHWIDYTEAYFANQTFPLDDPLGLLDDVPVAFGDYSWGIVVRPTIDTLDRFALAWEQELRIQRIGGRSVRKHYRMFNEDSNQRELNLLPDPVRLIGEVDLYNTLPIEDKPYIRLMPVFFRLGEQPVVMPATNIWIPSRATRRVEVSFPRPAASFFYMLGVFNDNTVSEPHDAKATVRLRSFIGAYKLQEYWNEFILPDASGPAFVFHTREWEIFGDLGGISGPEWISVVVDPVPIITVRLAHPAVDAIRVRIDGGLKDITDPFSIWQGDQFRQDWTVTATTDEMRWSAWAPGESSNRYFSVETARNAGIELPAPPSHQSVQYSLTFEQSAQCEVTTVDLQGRWPPRTSTRTEVYPASMKLIRILGYRFEEEAP